MKKHTIIGYEFLKNLKSQFLRSGALISLSHHERYDGSGYPYGIKGKEINIFARIVSVADVFDALVSERIYKDAWTLEEAFEEIKESSGKQFDPECVKAFSEGFSEIKEIFYKYNQEGVNNGRYL
ncbi:MAG: HD domain-containing protein [Thermotogae bacterium]|nr:HD domain-containing protein [Thermotogota bacterium]